MTEECAKWFENKYGKQHGCGERQTDWIQAAIEVDPRVIRQTLDELRVNGTGHSLNVGKPAPSVRLKRPKSSLTAEVGAKLMMPALPPMNRDIGRRPVYVEEGPQQYLKLVDRCGGGNDGMICLHCKPHIWLKSQDHRGRYLIGEIAVSGGDFTTPPGFITVPNGIPNCGVGGASYEGARCFDSIGEAIRYLKTYFRVIGCDGNTGWTQDKIDGID